MFSSFSRSVALSLAARVYPKPVTQSVRVPAVPGETYTLRAIITTRGIWENTPSGRTHSRIHTESIATLKLDG
jgi:hypothetical protein